MAFDFPTSPILGQQFTPAAGVIYTYNGYAWDLYSEPVITSEVRIRTFTSTQTYTPPPGLISAIIECIAPGGGGGGTVGSASFIYCGAGGGSGGYSRKALTAAEIGASKPITIGAVGAGGSAGFNHGQAAGDVSFGTLCIAKGGAGGQGYSGTGGAFGGSAGLLGTGDFTNRGSAGMNGGWIAASSGAWVLPVGGPGPFGGGNSTAMPVGGGVIGGFGTEYGGGGCGGVVHTAAANAAGGNGGPGVCFVTEFVR